MLFKSVFTLLSLAATVSALGPAKPRRLVRRADTGVNLLPALATPIDGDYDNCQNGKADFAVEKLDPAISHFTLHFFTAAGTPVPVISAQVSQNSYTNQMVSGNLLMGTKTGVQVRGTLTFDMAAAGITDCLGPASKQLMVQMISLTNDPFTGMAGGAQPAPTPTPTAAAGGAVAGGVVTVTVTSTVLVTVTAGAGTPPTTTTTAAAPPAATTTAMAAQPPAAAAGAIAVTADFDTCYGTNPITHQFAIEGLTIPEPGDNFVVKAAFADQTGKPVNIQVGAIYIGNTATTMGNILTVLQTAENNQIRGTVTTTDPATCPGGGKSNLVITPMSYTQNGANIAITKA